MVCWKRLCNLTNKKTKRKICWTHFYNRHRADTLKRQGRKVTCGGIYKGYLKPSARKRLNKIKGGYVY